MNVEHDRPLPLLDLILGEVLGYRSHSNKTRIPRRCLPAGRQGSVPGRPVQRNDEANSFFRIFLSKNPFHGFVKIRSDVVRFDLPGLSQIGPLSLSVSRKNQNASHPEGVAEGNIDAPIADHITAGEIEIQFLHRFFDQARSRFPAPALLPVGRSPRIRVVGTVIDSIETGPFSGQEVFHFLVNLKNQGLREIASRHSRLIRDDHRLESTLVQPPDRRP
jgi:hypothetical protein